MTDPPKDDQPQEQDVSQLLSHARQSLKEIRSFREQAEAQLKQVEVARKNADSESLLAFNAKNACEQHATAIASVKGTVEADANTIATNKQRSDEVLAAITSAKASVDADIRAVDGRRKEIDRSAFTVDQSATAIAKAAETGAGRLKDIDVSKESAENQLKIATDSAKAAIQASADAASALDRTGTSFTEAATLTAAISEHQKATDQAVQETQALLTKAQVAEQNLEKVLQHLAKSDEIATGHEKRVEALNAQLSGLIESVEGLLPGATSAGLASSFNKQRSRFTNAQKQWLWTFISCIVALVILAVPSFLSAIGWTTHPTEQSWNAAWRSLTLRLPIVLPIIWLAIYAGRNYMMSIRMEEDYAYKEAISTAFEGYKREMEKITTNTIENPTPYGRRPVSWA
jgi:hypothetical protein